MDQPDEAHLQGGEGGGRGGTLRGGRGGGGIQQSIRRFFIKCSTPSADVDVDTTFTTAGVSSTTASTPTVSSSDAGPIVYNKTIPLISAQRMDEIKNVCLRCALLLEASTVQILWEPGRTPYASCRARATRGAPHFGVHHRARDGREREGEDWEGAAVDTS